LEPIPDEVDDADELDMYSVRVTKYLKILDLVGTKSTLKEGKEKYKIKEKIK